MLLGFLAIIFSPPLPFEKQKNRLFQLKDRIQQPIREYPESAEFILERTIDITATQPVESWELRVHYPFEQIPDSDPGKGSIQDLRDIYISPMPTSETSAPKRIMTWEGSGNLQEHIVLRYTVKASTYRWELSPAESAGVEAIPQDIKDQYTGDEWAVDNNNDGVPEDLDNDDVPDAWRIFPSHPTIKNLAGQLAGEKATAYEKVKAIFDYLRSEFSYSTGRSGLPQAALQCLAGKTGDCDDQSILLVSLCRSMGIPAWLELGILYDPSTKAWEGHGWANVYIPLASGSYIIAPIDAVNNQFLFRDCYRFTEWIDNGQVGYFDTEGKWQQGALDKYYRSFNYRYVSPYRPEVSQNEDYKTVDMQTEGRVFISGSGGGEDTPGFEVVTLIPAVVVILILVTRRKKVLY